MPIFWEYFLEYCAIWILMGWGIYLVYRGGQIFNAAPFCMGVGAYFGAYFVRDLGWPYGLALIVAAGLGALAAFLPALVLGRAPAFTVAICTLALVIIFQQVVRNLEFLGGAWGLFNIPWMTGLLPITWAVVVIVGFFIYRLDHSRIGRAMEVIFVDPEAADTLGINIYRLRIFLMTIAGAISAVAGVFYASLLGTIYPMFFGFPMLLLLYSFVFIGGYTTMWGLVCLTPGLWALSVAPPAGIIAWRNIIYGSLLVAIIILRPEGLIDKNVVRAVSNKSREWLGQLRGLRKIEGSS